MIEAAIRFILKLFPNGAAWNKNPDSNLYKLAYAMAEEQLRVESRSLQLLSEADPRTTNELLEQWEKVFGLPGECVGLANSVAERRARVVAKMIGRMTQTKLLYVELANALGYELTVDNIVEGAPASHTFSVVVPANTIRVLRVDTARAGDRLREFGDDLLECVIEDNKPAHSVVNFVYV